MISQARKIVILGYSFPRTDDESRNLFKSAFVRMQSYPEVVIVDPAPERAFQVVSNEFGIPSNHIHVIREKLTNDFDVNRL